MWKNLQETIKSLSRWHELYDLHGTMYGTFWKFVQSCQYLCDVLTLCHWTLYASPYKSQLETKILITDRNLQKTKPSLNFLSTIGSFCRIDFLFSVRPLYGNAYNEYETFLLVCCEQYHMKMDLRQKSFRPNLLIKNVGSNLLQPTDFHMLRLTVNK